MNNPEVGHQKVYSPHNPTRLPMLLETIKKGKRVYAWPFGGPVLSVDLDDITEAPAKVKAGRMLETFAKYRELYYPEFLLTPSSGGNGFHLFLRYQEGPRVPAFQRACIVSHHGGDPTREYLSAQRFSDGLNLPYVLFETTETAKPLVRWAKEQEVSLADHRIMRRHLEVLIQQEQEALTTTSDDDLPW